MSAALLKSQSGDGLDAGSFVSVGMWHRVRKLNARLHKRHGAAAIPAALLQAADVPASPSSSDSGSSDSEAEGVPALLPFKADTARAANGTPVVSARACAYAPSLPLPSHRVTFCPPVRRSRCIRHRRIRHGYSGHLCIGNR